MSNLQKITNITKYLPLLVLILISTTAIASAPDTLWTRTFGGTDDDYGSSVQQTQDGGFIIAGRTTSFGAGKYDVYLIKTNSSGDTIWTKTYGGNSDDGGSSVQQTQDGGFIIAGYTKSFGWNVYLIKTDSLGDTLWTKTFGGTNCDESYSVQKTQDGGFIIVGFTYSFGTGTPNYQNVYLIRTNSSGDTLWTRTFGGTGNDCGNSVQQTQDGGFIIAGETESSGAGCKDIYLIKTNSSGDTLWTRTFGGTGDDEGYSVQQTSDSGFIIAGNINGDVYLVKINSSGDTLWTKTFGGTGADYGSSVQQTQDGGFIIAGFTDSFGASSFDIYMIRTNSSGYTLWTRTFGKGLNDYCGSVQQTEDGGFIVAGNTESFGAGGRDVYLIRLDKEVGIEEQSNLDFGFRNAELTAMPNPFYSKTEIQYNIKTASNVEFSIYNLAGKLVKEENLGYKSSGSYKVSFSKEEIPSGIYFYSIKTKDYNITKKLIILGTK